MSFSAPTVRQMHCTPAGSVLPFLQLHIGSCLHYSHIYLLHNTKHLAPLVLVFLIFAIRFSDSQWDCLYWVLLELSNFRKLEGRKIESSVVACRFKNLLDGEGSIQFLPYMLLFSFSQYLFCQSAMSVTYYSYNYGPN